MTFDIQMCGNRSGETKQQMRRDEPDKGGKPREAKKTKQSIYELFRSRTKSSGYSGVVPKRLIMQGLLVGLAEYPSLKHIIPAWGFVVMVWLGIIMVYFSSLLMIIN